MDNGNMDGGLVAVYGTLMQGGANHHYLLRAKYLGTETLYSLVLYDLGDYPGAVLQDSEGIELEVYSVGAKTLAALDALEEVNAESAHLGLYRRVRCSTQYGQAWIYLYNKDISGSNMLTKGRWQSS